MTKEERRAYNKAYSEKNRERISNQKKEYYAANREKRLAYYHDNKEMYSKTRRAYLLKSKYNLTVDEANEILARGCEVCGSTDKLCIDHDHVSGDVRGCLCNRCNLTLGHIEEVGLAVTLKLLAYQKERTPNV